MSEFKKHLEADWRNRCISCVYLHIARRTSRCTNDESEIYKREIVRPAYSTCTHWQGANYARKEEDMYYKCSDCGSVYYSSSETKAGEKCDRPKCTGVLKESTKEECESENGK